jgi:Tol biopolymer transport system component
MKQKQLSEKIPSVKHGYAFCLVMLLAAVFAGALNAKQTAPTIFGTVKIVNTQAAAQEKFAGYLGQELPDQIPQVFRLQTRDGFFASDRIAISADGKELYYTEVTRTWSDYHIRCYTYSDSKWNGPFDLFPGFLGPSLSVDNTTMFFEKYNDSRTCWQSKRTASGWSAPALCAELPDAKDKHYLQETASGRIYASSRNVPNGTGEMDISAYMKTDANNVYRSLGRPLNSPGNEGDFFVARDESFIIFGSPHRGGIGGGDLFISFRERDGSWSDPKNLGATINTPGFEFGPYVTDDMRYLFFSRSSDFSRVDIYWTRFDTLLEAIGAVRSAKPSGLPAHSYVIRDKPSDLIQNHEAVLALALQVEKDMQADLEKLDIQDKASLQRIYVGFYGIALLKKDYSEARRYMELVRGLLENPIAQLLTGLITIPYMQAVEAPGTDFHATFRTQLSKHLAALPFQDVQGNLNAMKSSQESASKERLIDSIAAGMDPAVKDGQVSQQIAEALVGAAMNLEVLLPLREDIVACMEGLFSANKASQPPANPAGTAVEPGIGTFKTGLKGIYFGQPLPGDTPVPFAPEILRSISAWVAGTAFSPDGTQLFVSVGAADYSGAKLYYSTRVNGEWTTVVAAPFVSDFIYSNEPFFSSDGRTLTFTGRKSIGTQDLWTVAYANGRWGTPVALPSPINSAAKEFRGSTMADGTLYFTSARSGMYQVYRGYQDATQTLMVELVGAPISTNSYEGDPCIAPNGRFLIFNSARDGKSADLYVSFRDARGGWGTPINLGLQFNSADDEYGAHLSADGKYLFFTRHTAKGNTIYWVDINAIEKFKPVNGTGPYFGQKPPEEKPEIFASHIVSLENRLETYPTFSPDGKEMFFSVVNAAWTEGKILYARLENGAWTKPEVAPFSHDRYINWESFISPDGKRMFFASNRPPSSSMDVWMVERTSDASWSAPVRLSDPVNSLAEDGSACVANSGTLYFKSLRSGGAGTSWLYRAILKDGAYTQIESLGNIIKTTSGETEPYVSPDESYLIFISQTRAGGKGGWDLWICFRNHDGSWTQPVNMGPKINTADDEYGPRVTHDGKYLFFTREKRGKTMDIYWISAKIMNKIKK